VPQTNKKKTSISFKNPACFLLPPFGVIFPSATVSSDFFSPSSSLVLSALRPQLPPSTNSQVCESSASAFFLCFSGLLFPTKPEKRKKGAVSETKKDFCLSAGHLFHLTESPLLKREKPKKSG